MLVSRHPFKDSRSANESLSDASASWISNKRARATGDRPQATATVYTVKNSEGDKRHFTLTEEGQVVECESMEAGFGELLLQPHETRGFEHKGVFCRTHKFSLCWSGYELYHPRSAEDLAKLREIREHK